MTASDFDKAFGSTPNGRAGFTERVRPDGGKPANDDCKDDIAGDYKAYGYLPTNSVGETCEVIRWLEGTDVPEGIEFQYRFLMQIGFLGDEEIKLFLPDCIVFVRGKHLRELRKKLARRQVTFIQQYASRLWGQLKSAETPVIETIQIIRSANV